jgi:hypothetical protein
MTNVMQSQLTDDELDKRIERILCDHQGKERSVRRWDLVVEIFGAGFDLPRNDTNVYDRRVRESVERLRNHGWLILNLNDGRGRYLCATEEEYWEFRMKYVQQVKSIAAVIRCMDSAARRKYPNLLQPSLFDLESLEVQL